MLPIVSIHSTTLSSKINSNIHKLGWCIIDSDTDYQSFVEFARKLGPMMHHDTADDNHCVEVSPILGKGNYSTGEVSLRTQDNRDLALHTDAPFLKCLPGFSCMQMVTTAEEGGETCLLDLLPAIEMIQQSDDSFFKELLTRNFLFKRGDYICEAPILQKVSETHYCVRHHPDRVKYTTQEEFSFLKKFKHYFDFGTHYTFQMRPGWIVLIDNMRLLHGRNAFTGIRKLRRIWGYIDYFNYDKNSNHGDYFVDDIGCENLLSSPLGIQLNI